VDKTAEARRERLIVDEKIVFFWIDEGFGFGMEGNAGNDEMNVRVMLDLAAPGVQHAGETESRAMIFGGGDVLEGGGALAQDERIEDFGMNQAEGAQFRRQGEGDHEVGHRQEPGFLFGRPDLLVERTALRATAVIATVIGIVLLVAAVADVELAAEQVRTAREDAPHGPVVVVGELVSVGTGVVEPVLTEQICELQGQGESSAMLEIGEGGERVSAFGFADLGEMQVADDFLERAVTEIGGDLPDRCPAFQHVGTVTVTQGMGRYVIVLF